MLGVKNAFPQFQIKIHMYTYLQNYFEKMK